MTYKIIDTREKRTMTKRQEEAVIREFERFQPEGSTHIKLPQPEHLVKTFRKNVCCEHAWVNVQALDGEGTKNMQEIFSEKELGDRQTFCSKCKALALWERGQIFAYDAIALQPEKPEREERRPNRKERRS